jgi:peptidoglycan/xylan/chitin deacetylase (PgdA/CDA1 family)
MKSLFITYHDLYENTPVPGSLRTANMYHVSKATFVRHVQAIKASGKRVITIDDFLRSSQENLNCNDGSIIMTFDDGWRGAFEIAIPLLQEVGWKATFFVTKDFIGHNGFCNRENILEAAKAGMEVGVHGTTHRMLPSCSPEEVVREFIVCKSFLESILGKPIEFASLPGGDWSNTVASCAREAGLKCLCTSRPGINNVQTSPFNLARLVIRATMRDKDLSRYCRFNINKELLRWTLFEIPRRLFGMKNYARFRKWLIAGPENMRDKLI